MSQTRDKVVTRAAELMARGYHCSDSTVIAMSEHLWGEVNPQLVRAARAFLGGVAGTEQELCGALSGGIMIIGALLSPELPYGDETRLRQTVIQYRDRFITEIGAETGVTQCATLRAELYGTAGKEPCSVLVQRAVRILLEVLNENT